MALWKENKDSAECSLKIILATSYQSAYFYMYMSIYYAITPSLKIHKPHGLLHIDVVSPLYNTIDKRDKVVILKR